MNPDTNKENPQKIASETLKQYISTLNAEDTLLLLSLFSGNVTPDLHTPERTQRLFAMLKDLGIHDPDAEAKQTDEQRIEMYSNYGLEVTVPKGRCGFSENLMCAAHDGVPYCVDDHGHFFKEQDDSSIKHSILHRELMIERHHDKIKQVYEYCTTLDRGDIWVLCGGGVQLEAFFGCRNGYLATLSLSLEKDPFNTPKQKESVTKKVSRLQPNFEHNEPLFKGLKIDGVKVRYFPRNTLEP
jgi:hypothetical protein